MSNTGSLQRLLAVLICLAGGAAFAQAAAIPNPPANLSLRLTPSPVELFRMLLSTNAAGREAWLSTKPAASRAAIEAKLSEYEAMAPEQREQKLRASQLSWYLPALMKMPTTNRATVLAAIPGEDRKVIELRLAQIIILPPPMLNQIITNQSLLRMMLMADAGQLSGNSALALVSPDQKRLAEQVYPVWKKLLELGPSDRSKPLLKLTAADKSNMELALSKLGQLSGQERAQAMAGFRKFAELPASEREAFLNTAERWKAMSEKDRDIWRNVAATLQRPPSSIALPMPPPLLRPDPAAPPGTNG